MHFKTEQIEKDYATYESKHILAQDLLKRYVYIIDLICQMLGWGEITITDYLRRDDKYKRSYHHIDYGLAVDIRLNDKPVAMYLTLYAVCKAIEAFKPNLRCNFHPEDYHTNNRHIHIESRLH